MRQHNILSTVCVCLSAVEMFLYYGSSRTLRKGWIFTFTLLFALLFLAQVFAVQVKRNHMGNLYLIAESQVLLQIIFDSECYQRVNDTPVCNGNVS